MYKRKQSPPRPTGRPPKHGAYSIVYRAALLEKYPELTRYVMDSRDALVKDQAPGGLDTLSAAKSIILDRVAAKMLMAGQLDIFLGEKGIIRRDKLELGILEAEPAVGTWLAVNAAILRDLEALGLERKVVEDVVMSLDELVVAVKKERKAAGEAEEPRQMPQDERTQADTKEDTDKKGRPTGGDLPGDDDKEA